MKNTEKQVSEADIIRQLAPILEASEQLGAIFREHREEIILGAINDFQKLLAKDKEEQTV